MNVFQGIGPPQVTDDVLAQAAGLVVGKVTSTTAPRSLCEIQADEDDYLWLCSWAWQLTYYQLRRWLSGVNSRRTIAQSGNLVLSYAESAGCLLLLLAAEAGRREAREGNLWAAVRKRFSDPAGRAIFAQGQPRREFKDALEVAARKLGLRHVFGIEGTQNYYLTVYLQFGFTKSGMGRLPYWLAGQPVSGAVSYLLGSEDKGERQSSRSFMALWDTLRNYRRNNVRETSARQALASNPWVIPAWIDELLAQAKLHLDLGTADAETEAGESLPSQFLTEPKLRWTWPEAPVFGSAVVNLADFDLTADRYHLKAGNHTLTVLLRNDSGGYSSTRERVVLPSDSPEYVVAMVDENGTEPIGQLLQLWNPEEDVELFDLGTGDRLDAYSAQRAPSKDYGLLVSSDLTVEPPGLRFHSIGAGAHAKRLYLLEANNAYRVRVILSDAQGLVGELWNSEIGGVRSKPSEPDWANSIHVEVHPLDQRWLGVYRGIRVSGLSTDTTMQYIRVAGRPVDFNLEGNGAYLSEAFDISSCISATPPYASKVKLGLRRSGEQAFIERTCWVNAVGVMRASDDGWMVVDPSEQLAADEARKWAYKLVLPGDGSAAPKLALMEGPVFLRKPSWSRPTNLGPLAGYGASLEIRAPYNPIEGEGPVIISNEVRNPGILVNAAFDTNEACCLRFRHSLEPGLSHQIVFWDIGAPPVLWQSIDIVDHKGIEWYVPSPDDSSGPCCVAVAYQGEVLGSWWPEEIAPIRVKDEGSALTTAAMLKWMRAPIVASGWIRAVQAFAQQYPAQTLAAWLLDEGLPDELSYGSAAAEQWGAAVREIFTGWNPDAESANNVIQALGGVAFKERDSDALQLLLREAPLLMGRVTKAWLTSHGSPEGEVSPNKVDLIDHLRFRIAAVPDEMKSPFLMEQWERGELDCEPMSEPLTVREKFAWEGERRQELLNDAANEMDVATGYIDNAIQKVIGPLDYDDLDYTDQCNVETALNTRPFRELLGLRILSALVQEIRQHGTT
jgi:hypothetical protein